MECRNSKNFEMKCKTDGTPKFKTRISGRTTRLKGASPVSECEVDGSEAKSTAATSEKEIQDADLPSFLSELGRAKENGVTVTQLMTEYINVCK